MFYTLTILIPVYNEENNIENTLINIYRALQNYSFTFEIILVNDGSTDNTIKLISSIKDKYKNLKIINHNKNLGFGASYKTGLSNANSIFFLMIQGDNAWDYKNLNLFLNYLGKYDLVLGYTSNMLKYRGLIRTTISVTFTKLLNLFSKSKIIYFNGLQIHKTDIIKKISIESNNYTFQAEIILKTKKYYNNIKFVNIKPNDRDYGFSKAFRIKNIIETILFVLKSIKYRK